MWTKDRPLPVKISHLGLFCEHAGSATYSAPDSYELEMKWGFGTWVFILLQESSTLLGALTILWVKPNVPIG